MENLKIFTNEEFGNIGVIVKNNKEYFEAIPVAEVLGYTNPRAAIIRHCEEDGVTFRDVGVVRSNDANGSDYIQYVSKKFIDEGNVYRLIIKSKLPSAKRFEKWIMEEVIPSIRTNGAYMSDEVINKTLQDPDFIIEMATKLKEERKKTLLAQKKIKGLEECLAFDKPYTDFGKCISSCEEAITIGQFAKLLNNNNINIGRNRLFSFFREEGYLIKTGKDKNTPKQPYIKSGLFKVCETIINTENGEKLSITTLITGKGQKYFLDILK
ncbi:MAG: phage antirepressor KilAC domain-containing protein [Peptostreptococcaceae bacterium]